MSAAKETAGIAKQLNAIPTHASRDVSKHFRTTDFPEIFSDKKPYRLECVKNLSLESLQLRIATRCLIAPRTGEPFFGPVSIPNRRCNSITRFAVCFRYVDLIFKNDDSNRKLFFRPGRAGENVPLPPVQAKRSARGCG